jgi:2-dehydro-3-deoxygluconokinase
MLELAPVGDGIYRLGYAGDTFNTAWHMAQLLGDTAKVGFVTQIGSDRLSDTFATEMTADGLDISGVSRSNDRGMGLYLIELDGFERSFHYWRQCSAARLLADDPLILARAISNAGLIHLSGITLAILSERSRSNLFDVLARARGSGAVVSFDPNIRPRLWSSLEEIHATISRMLSITDIALPSFDDEATHWKDASPNDTIGRFVSFGVKEVVVKNGGGNVRIHADGEDGEYETPAVERIRDTTGAGDAFNAGYLSARLMGRSPKQAILSGHKLSSEVIQQFGARAAREAVRAMTLDGAD